MSLTNLEKMNVILNEEKKALEENGKSKRTKGSKSGKTVDGFKFSVYVLKTLNHIHPDMGLSGDAGACMVNIVKINISKIMSAVNQLILRTGAKTITARDIEAAVTLMLPGELAKQSKSQATAAVAKYLQDIEDGEKGQNPKQRSTRAGLIFNITRVENLMMLESNTVRKSATAAVFLSAVIEYLISEILELAGNAARDSQRKRITPRHIKIVILNDEELRTLYQDTIIAGGVLPNINSALLPSSDRKKKARVAKPKDAAAKPKVTKPKITKAVTKPKEAKNAAKPAAKPKVAKKSVSKSEGVKKATAKKVTTNKSNKVLSTKTKKSAK